MKRKLILMCVAGVLVMTAIIGGTLAGFNTSTESKGVTNITVKELGITMVGTGTEANQQADSIGKGATPGGEVALQHSVTNNVEGGYSLYTRVTIDKKWNDESLDPAKIRLYVEDKETNTKKELLAGTTVNYWIVWYADDEQVIMYYTKPLAQGASSSNLIDAVSFDAQMDNSYAGKSAEISFSADAVQQIAAEDSIPSEWGVYPTIDANGVITSIEE